MPLALHSTSGFPVSNSGTPLSPSTKPLTENFLYHRIYSASDQKDAVGRSLMQIAQNGKRIKKKKSFFDKKAPLPPVELPAEWGGRINEAPTLKKSDRKKSERSTNAPPIVLPKLKQRQADRYEEQRKKPTGVEKADVVKTDAEKTDAEKTGRVVYSSEFKGLGTGRAAKGVDLAKVPVGGVIDIPIPLKKQQPILRNAAKKREVLRSTDKSKGAESGLKNEPGNKKGAPLIKEAAIPVPPPVTIWPAADVIAAQNACKVLLRGADVLVKPLKPVRYGACGTPAPLKLKAVNETDPERVTINPAATLNCNFTARFAKWVKKKLQPLAKKHLNSPVRMVHNVSSYSCRYRYNDSTKKLSEHGRANALDIAGFTLKDGTSVSVLKHWDEEGDLGAFLKDVHKAACKDFVVVLGPNANAAHKDHFHFDIGRYPVCE